MTPINGVRRGSTHVDLDELTWDPADVLRLARLAREIRLTDQILTPDMDTVSVVEDGPAPAWTTLEGDHVTFAAKKMPPPNSPINVAIWLGTNAHELGHVLFTPRTGSRLLARLFDADRTFMPGLAKLHNIVEDQREERLLIARFAPWRAYLIGALSHHLVVDSESAWLLLCGRTWLPDAMRADARAKFVTTRSEAIAAKVATLIGNYQRLTDPGESEHDEAFAILDELWNIFCDKLPQIPTGCTTVISDGDPDTDSPEASDTPPAADEQSPQADSDASEGDDGQGEPAADKQGDSDGNSAGDADAKADAPTSGESRTNSTPPSTSTPSNVNDPKQVREDLRKAAEDALRNDKDARRDLDNVLDALRQSPHRDGVQGEVPLGEFKEPTDAARKLHHEVGDALLDLKDETEPGWQRRTDSGRLNTRRLLTSNAPYDELFDRFQPGEMDATDFEVALLLDTSSSMRRYVEALAEATWAVQQASDDLEAAVTIITWNGDEHRVVAESGNRPDGRVFVPAAWGGTDPVSALNETFRLLADSQARNRIMLILTDGQWSNEEQAARVIAAMNEVGITTAFAFLGAENLFDGNSHGCAVSERIDRPQGLALMFRRIAAERIKAAF